MNKVGDSLDFVGWGGNKGESVGRFVADGGHTDCAKIENTLKNARLFEAYIFDSRKFDNASRMMKETRGRDLDGTFVGYKKFIAEVDFCTDKANEKD